MTFQVSKSPLWDKGVILGKSKELPEKEAAKKTDGIRPDESFCTAS
ncbi:MAG: hypothetical protein K8R54_04205 [Bacteroidales bacterium]|nr:hypothetical protein [Bacteroidales bacterium]